MTSEVTFFKRVNCMELSVSANIVSFISFQKKKCAIVTHLTSRHTHHYLLNHFAYIAPKGSVQNQDLIWYTLNYHICLKTSFLFNVGLMHCYLSVWHDILVHSIYLIVRVLEVKSKVNSDTTSHKTWYFWVVPYTQLLGRYGAKLCNHKL